MVYPGITDETARCFVAWDLEQGRTHPDPRKDLTLRRLPFRDAVTAALDGTISDAASVATLLALPADLLRRLGS